MGDAMSSVPLDILHTPMQTQLISAILRPASNLTKPYHKVTIPTMISQILEFLQSS